MPQKKPSTILKKRNCLVSLFAWQTPSPLQGYSFRADGRMHGIFQSHLSQSPHPPKVQSWPLWSKKHWLLLLAACDTVHRWLCPPSHSLSHTPENTANYNTGRPIWKRQASHSVGKAAIKCRHQTSKLQHVKPKELGPALCNSGITQQ